MELWDPQIGGFDSGVNSCFFGMFGSEESEAWLGRCPSRWWILVLVSPGAGGVAVALPAHRVFVSQLCLQCSGAIIA